MKLNSERSGHLVEIDSGNMAFIPSSLSSIGDLFMDPELLILLSEADVSLGRLDGLSDLLPDPDLFVLMYIKKEAVLSSQIEGTQASLMDVLEFEAKALRPDAPEDVGEVANYIAAVHKGVDLLKEGGSIDLQLIRELHSILMKETRGGSLTPGEFRTIQNWIGPPGCSLDDALYVPPPPREMMAALKELEIFILKDASLPPLIKAAMVHAQFESIHPFLDGNGRMGRLLITLILLKEGHLRSPLLYLSYYLKQMRFGYYEKLQNVRMSGDYEGWLKFFLVGVSAVSEEASSKARSILKLASENREMILSSFGRNGPRAVQLLDSLLRRPVLGVRGIGEITGISYQNANGLAQQLEELGILVEVTGQKRNRVFEFKDYLDLLER